VIQPKKDERQIERIFPAASVAEKSAPSPSEAKEPVLELSELVHLRQFFDLLAKWNESQEGEPKDE
jgi:hypothetical protein